MAQTTSFTLNGGPVKVSSPANRALVDVLRYDLGLTGTKQGCGAGLCGACTVLLDGEPVPSCATSLGDVAGRTVLTIEGLKKNGVLDPVQQAFVDHNAFQCGFCTPGMILTAVAFLKKKPRANRAEIMAALEGNLCRCGTHGRIVAAVAAVAAGGVR
jgi:aerobic-type carbon monoxide dehydrogenase small subunit (CoxS/CutS family)